MFFLIINSLHRTPWQAVQEHNVGWLVYQIQISVQYALDPKTTTTANFFQHHLLMVCSWVMVVVSVIICCLVWSDKVKWINILDLYKTTCTPENNIKRGTGLTSCIENSSFSGIRTEQVDVFAILLNTCMIQKNHKGSNSGTQKIYCRWWYSRHDIQTWLRCHWNWGSPSQVIERQYSQFCDKS